MGPEDKPSRMSQVNEEMNTLENRITALQEIVNMARERLSPVLVIAPPNKQLEKVARTDESRVPLADAIRAQRYRVNSAVEELNDILQSCEL